MTDEPRDDQGEQGSAPQPDDLERVEGPVPPAAGDELVVVDGRVAADFPPAPPGVQWSTYGLDAPAPPPPRGLFAAAAIALLAIAGWTLLGTGLVTPHIGTALVVAGWVTAAVLTTGLVTLRSPAFAAVSLLVLVLSIPSSGVVWLVDLAWYPRDAPLMDRGLPLIAGQVAFVLPAVLGLIASLRRRRPPRALQIVAVSLAGLGVLWGAVVGGGSLVFEPESVTVGVVWGTVALVLGMPAAAALIGLRRRSTRFVGAGIAALAAPLVALPGPNGWDALQLLALPPIAAAAACAALAARRTVDEPSYGDQTMVGNVPAHDARPEPAAAHDAYGADAGAPGSAGAEAGLQPGLDPGAGPAAPFGTEADPRHRRT